MTVCYLLIQTTQRVLYISQQQDIRLYKAFSQLYGSGVKQTVDAATKLQTDNLNRTELISKTQSPRL